MLEITGETLKKSARKKKENTAEIVRGAKPTFQTEIHPFYFQAKPVGGAATQTKEKRRYDYGRKNDRHRHS